MTFSLLTKPHSSPPPSPYSQYTFTWTWLLRFADRPLALFLCNSVSVSFLPPPSLVCAWEHHAHSLAPRVARVSAHISKMPRQLSRTVWVISQGLRCWNMSLDMEPYSGHPEAESEQRTVFNTCPHSQVLPTLALTNIYTHLSRNSLKNQKQVNQCPDLLLCKGDKTGCLCPDPHKL